MKIDLNRFESQVSQFGQAFAIAIQCFKYLSATIKIGLDYDLQELTFARL